MNSNGAAAAGATKECPICMDRFNTGAIVPKVFGACGHSVCAVCVPECILRAGHATCPLCRQETTVPPNGLPTNYALKEDIATTARNRGCNLSDFEFTMSLSRKESKDLQKGINKVPDEVRALFIESMSRSLLSNNGMHQLTKSFLELQAKKKLSVQSFFIVFVDLVEREAEISTSDSPQPGMSASNQNETRRVRRADSDSDSPKSAKFPKNENGRR